MSDSESKRCKRIKLGWDSPLTNDETNTVHSCWNIVNDDWMLINECSDDRIYVHRDILEWIVDVINKNILNDDLRAQVEEVYHHNLDGQVYIIKFYDRTFELEAKLREDITGIKEHLKYKMPWKTNPSYFLKIDSGFEDRKQRIMTELQKTNLLNHCNNIVVSVINWLYIPKIEIYEFSENLTKTQIEEIDLIFEKMSESLSPLYICDQFEWHKEYVVDEIFDVDTLAMDICTEEWRRYDLLKDFQLTDILRLDIANKDYQDPYYNEYLERYLKILLNKFVPTISSVNEERYEFQLIRLNSYTRHYFASKFYNKIYSSDVLDIDQLLTRHDIPQIETKEEKLFLFSSQPPPEQLLTTKSRHILYDLLNYVHFSDSLFQVLLNMSNERQRYVISFGQEFEFIYGSEKEYLSDLSQESSAMFNTKNIIVILKDCIENNVEKLANYVKHLFDLFKEREKSNIEISIYFTNCKLDDYSFLENIGNCIDIIKFEEMVFTPQQIKSLSRSLSQQKMVRFENCENITDCDVMALLEHIDFDCLYIEGENACTILVYFLMAEHLMIKEGVNTIRATRFSFNVIDCCYETFSDSDLELYEFAKIDNQIVVRNVISNEICDLLRIRNHNMDDEAWQLNSDSEDEPFHSSNNVYNE